MIALVLRHRFLTAMLVVLILGFGFHAFTNLPINALPDLTPNQVVVIVEAPGLVAQEVESRVTVPIEAVLNGIPGIEGLRSISKLGLSMVTVVFRDNLDPYFIRQRVQERLQSVNERLPAGLHPEVAPLASAMGEIYQYTVGGPYPLEQLKTIQEWTLKPALRQIQGISEINTWGGYTRQYQLVVDPTAMQRYGITLGEISAAIQRNNANFSAGAVSQNHNTYPIRGTGRISGLDDLAAIPVTTRDGSPVRLAQLGDVRIGHAVRSGAVTVNGKQESVSGMVLMLKGEDIGTISRRVKAKVAELLPTLPPGVTITPFYDQTALVDRTIGTVRTNLTEGALLVAAVLFVFLGSARPALIVALVIPCSLLFAFIGMTAFAIPANIVSLGAMDFGMVVDGAIVMMESVMRKRTEHPDRPIDDLITEAGQEVMRPIIFGVGIITAVYLPILSLEGTEGKMFRPMAITVAMTLAGSLLLTLTLVPILSSLLLKHHPGEKHSRLFERLQERYADLLRKALPHPLMLGGTAVALFAVAIGSLAVLGSEFMPGLDEGDILIESRKLASIDLKGSVDVTLQLEKALKQVPEVRRVVTKIGRPDIATEAMGIHEGDMYLSLKDQKAWRPGMTKAKIIEALEAQVATVAGVKTNFSQPIAMRVNELVSGVKSDVAVKVYGEDIATLERLGEEVEKRLTAIAGVKDLQREKINASFEWQVVPQRDAMARLGVAVDDLQEVLLAATQGMPVSQVLVGEKRFDLTVTMPDSVRENPFRLAEMPVSNGDGIQPLGAMASFERQPAPYLIARDSGSRRLVVACNVRGRDLGGFVTDAKEAVAGITMPTGYRLAWGGQFENQVRAMNRLALVVPATLAIIGSLLFLHFASVRRVVLIMTALPLAMIGGVAALWVRGFYLNVPAVIGFVALFGVAILHGLVMITCIDDLVKTGMPADEAVVTGASSRLRPVLMTALVATLGFIPMAASHGAGAEVQKPLATVVIGGMITATALTLLLLPVLYRRWIPTPKSRDQRLTRTAPVQEGV
jgi:cobalt-zinc-cadmium resistance protein CzcA